MYVDRIFPGYSALCVLSLFSGIRYMAGGIVLRPFDVMMGVGLFLLVGAACVRGRVRPLRKPGVFHAFVILYIYRFLNGVFLSSTGEAVKELIQGGEFIVLIYMIGMATSTVEGRKKFLNTLLWGFGIIAVFTAVWHIGQGQFANYKQLGASKMSFSLFGLFAIGSYLKKRNRLSWGIMLFAILLTLLSGERKGWVALVAAGGVVFFVMRGMRIRAVIGTLLRPKVIILSGLGGVVLVTVAAQFEYISRQFQSMQDIFLLLSQLDLNQTMEGMVQEMETSGSNMARLYLLLVTVRTLMEHPFWGGGTGRFKELVEQMAVQDGGGYVLDSHSEYQRFAAENGFTGLFLYTAIWFFVIRRTIKFVKSVHHHHYYTCITILAFAVYGAVVNQFLAGGALNVVFMAASLGLVIGLENEPSVFKIAYN